MSGRSTEEGKEKVRRRLAYILDQQQQRKQQSSSSSSAPRSSSSTTPQSTAANPDRPPTEAEQEEFALQMLKENDEMKKAFVTSYYVIQGLLGFWAAYLLMANIETPWANEAFHLGPFRLVLESRDVNLALGFVITSMVLCSIAAFFQNVTILRASLIMCVYPFLRIGSVFLQEVDIPLSSQQQSLTGLSSQRMYFIYPFWKLLWLPLGAPIIIGIQMVVMKLFRDMDNQVVDFYRRNKVPLKGV